MSLYSLCDPNQPYAVPTAILSSQDVEDWFVTPSENLQPVAAALTGSATIYHHPWQSPVEGHKVPAGNHRDKICGLGVLGIRGTGWFRGASAVLSITPDPPEPNMRQPFWFAACSLEGASDDRNMGVAVPDDISAYTD